MNQLRLFDQDAQTGDQSGQNGQQRGSQADGVDQRAQNGQDGDQPLISGQGVGAATADLPLPIEQVQQVIVSYSGGKDSTAALLAVLDRFPRDKVTVIFADTGAEHPDTYAYMRYIDRHVFPIKRLAQRAIGVRRTKRGGRPTTENILELVDLSWSDPVGARGVLTFADYVRRRKLRRPDTAGWPSPGNRFCTKSMKQQSLAKWIRQRYTTKDRLNMLQVIGLRRDESANRVNTPDYGIDPDSGCWNWYPIASWSDFAAAAYVASKGVPLNPEYKTGSRVGCSICFYESPAGIAQKERHMPGLLDPFVELETEIGSWTKNQSLAAIRRAANGPETQQLPLFQAQEPITCMSGFCDTGVGFDVPESWLWKRPRVVIDDQTLRDHLRARLEQRAGLHDHGLIPTLY